MIVKTFKKKTQEKILLHFMLYLGTLNLNGNVFSASVSTCEVFIVSLSKHGLLDFYTNLKVVSMKIVRVSYDISIEPCESLVEVLSYIFVLLSIVFKLFSN